jgi:hypothetical protein
MYLSARRKALIVILIFCVVNYFYKQNLCVLSGCLLWVTSVLSLLWQSQRTSPSEVSTTCKIVSRLSYGSTLNRVDPLMKELLLSILFLYVKTVLLLKRATACINN